MIDYFDINIAVILPSRGMCFAETIKELLEELSDVPHKIYWSHGNSLPACFNKPLSRALKGPHSHIWFIEDDMVLKKGILKELLGADVDLIAADYPLAQEPSGTILYDEFGDAIFSGTGCLLVKKPVFETMPRPIFISNIKWDFVYKDGYVEFVAKKVDPNSAYGMHDINFGLYHYMKGNPIKVTSTSLAQRKLVKKGATATNAGTDSIVLYDKLRKMKPIDFPEKPKDTQLRQIIIDGKQVMVRQNSNNEKIKNSADIPVIKKNGIILNFEQCPQAERLFK